MHKKAISKKLLTSLNNISKIKSLENFFLAGGTALALQIGHRVSDDIDFFSLKEFKSSLFHLINKKLSVKAISVSDESIEFIHNGIKVLLMYWGYPLQEKFVNWEGIKLTHPRDIGFMKLLCLQGRTSKKDIIDLYFIHKKVIQLDELISDFNEIYPKDSFNSYDSFKKLINRDILEKDEMPKMLEDVLWDKAFKTVKNALKAYVGTRIGS